MKILMTELRKRQKTMLKNKNCDREPLQRELEQNQLGTNRLHEAVEKGLIPLDDSLKLRSHKLQARREEILLELAKCAANALRCR